MKKTEILGASRDSVLNRKNALIGFGSLALAACAGGGTMAPLRAVLGASSRRVSTMSLPAGYTTSSAVNGNIATTTLLYQGSAIATLQVDTTTFITTLTSLLNGQSITTASPKGLTAGSTWQATPAIICTVNSTGDGGTVVAGGQGGYVTQAVDPNTNNYYAMLYHPAGWTAPSRVNSHIQAGGGDGDPKCQPGHVCPHNGYSCAEAIVLTGCAGIGLVGSGAALFTDALTPFAVAGLVVAHFAFGYGLMTIARECL